MKTEYKTMTGKNVAVEIVTEEVIGRDDFMGDIRRPCWKMRITVDGKWYAYSGTGKAEYNGASVNVICVMGGKIVVTNEAWGSVKSVIDCYEAGLKDRMATAARLETEYNDHCAMMQRIMGE